MLSKDLSCVTHHSLENLSLKEGKEVTASFKATAIHVVRKGGGWEGSV
jgi:molybdopterin-binding protein